MTSAHIAPARLVNPEGVTFGNASLTVGGNIELARALAGCGGVFTGVNADAQIGPVSVGGAWIASNLLAGIDVGGDGLAGTFDDSRSLAAAL